MLEFYWKTITASKTDIAKENSIRIGTFASF